jgi:hypothetical protein
MSYVSFLYIYYAILAYATRPAYATKGICLLHSDPDSNSKDAGSP